MAILNGTTIEGTLTLAKEGYIKLHSCSGSWLNGFSNAPILCPDAENNSSYYPWIAQKNTSSNIMVTVGTYQNYFVIAGSTTSRTANGYDNALFFNMSNGHLSLNNKYLYLHSNNYNNYAPSKTGSGASGTWGINISGNAAGLSKVLPVSKGGTGRSSFTTNGVLYFYNNSISNSSRYVADNSSLGIVSTTGNSDISVNNYYNCVKIFVSNNAGIYCRALGFTDGTISDSKKKKKNTAYYHSIQDWLIYINSAGVVTKGTSDRRKKFYIEDLSENETKVLLNTPIRNFIFKEDVNENNLEQNGIFAQDLREAMKANNISNRPWLQWEYNDNDRDDVYYDINAKKKDDMTYSVSYNHMVPALIKGWQMQNKEIEELEKKLAILRIKRLNK